MKVFSTFFLIMLFPLSLLAETPEKKGLAIAREAKQRDEGWVDSKSEMEMELKNRHGETSIRRIKSRTLEVLEDGDKSLMVFKDPKDVKGTAMLTVSHKVKNDDQWLFLPALRRVKRISSSNKSGSFMGSEFAYEDLSSREVEKYTYKYLGNEPCPNPELGGISCFVVESYPVDRKSGYTRLISWIDEKEYRTAKVTFYDRKESHLKTLSFKGFKKYLGKFWRNDELRMENHQSGRVPS
ncbi:MAG: outer membrane lipoprotein-sorting protein [Calditrichia bacterium]